MWFFSQDGLFLTWNFELDKASIISFENACDINYNQRHFFSSVVDSEVLFICIISNTYKALIYRNIFFYKFYQHAVLTDETSSTLRLKPKPKSIDSPSLALNLLLSLLSSTSAVLFSYINVALPHFLELSSLICSKCNWYCQTDRLRQNGIRLNLCSFPGNLHCLNGIPGSHYWLLRCNWQYYSDCRSGLHSWNVNISWEREISGPKNGTHHYCTFSAIYILLDVPMVLSHCHDRPARWTSPAIEAIMHALIECIRSILLSGGAPPPLLPWHEMQSGPPPPVPTLWINNAVVAGEFTPWQALHAASEIFTQGVVEESSSITCFFGTSLNCPVFQAGTGEYESPL